jgi:Flp pilus assembly protein TadD
MREIRYNIVLAGLLSLLLTGCGAEVSQEEIREMPHFSVDYYQQGLKAVNDIIESYPQNADAYFKKAVMLEKLDNPENAIINYKKAVRLDSLNATYYRSLATLFYKQGKLKRAEENALRAERLGDHTADLHLLLAEIHIRNETYNIALNHLNRAIDAAPGNSTYIIRKGMVYMHLQDTARAQEFFLSNMYRIKPDANLYEALADIYKAGKNYTQSLQYLDSSLLLSDRLNERIIVKKSDVLQKSGNVREAKNIINQYLHQDSANFAFNFKLAELHFNTYVYDSALHYLNNAILLDSKSKESYMLLGKVYDRKRMYYTARDQYSNALLIDTSYQQAKQAMYELDKKLAYIQRAKRAEETKRSLPQLETIKPVN